jgi:uncharacterized protein YggT (Ycf19 family)
MLHRRVLVSPTSPLDEVLRQRLAANCGIRAITDPVIVLWCLKVVHRTGVSVFEAGVE